MINKPTISILAICLALIFHHKSLATEMDTSRSIFDVMNYQEVVDITIETDLDSIRARRRSKEELKTILSFQDAQGNLQRWEAKLSIRGKFRRVNCDVPPLRIDLKKSHLREAGLQEYDDFEIVTHCLDDDFLAGELLLKEYLTYRLYNEITPFSYQTQLARITYKNPATGEEVQQWGIIIEDTAQLSDRIAAEEVEGVGFPIDTFNQSHLEVMALFQYMIGNTDWDLETSRNLKFFLKNDKLIPIPYDFDFSDLVDAPYARRPNDSMRYDDPGRYLGPVEIVPEIVPTLRFYQSQRKAILKKVKKLKLLSFQSRKNTSNYLEEFFDISAWVREKTEEQQFSRK